ncbi:acyltransferase [Serratia marcescens]|uniref:acyltransferase family protein n=1 Tax=Serratia TaxID=613 RepID=UPI0018661B29|nr:acyltransferase [Serratia marcescens]MBN5273128.1 acyltransferase [Serratia marcescens]MBN5276088.1 acyltransferase [Serratia marcescens]MBN5306510.1 acyltransferase [Serratia marcescens]MBN5364916.1 acyltransferase [Serratia marcescens]MBN5420335.1 acyltransferase [Serratia marcescens]
MQPIQQKTKTQNVKYHFDSIDILRGFAAVSVVVYHVIEHFNWTSFPTNWPWLWFRFGWMGVDMFFVISGFVIAMSAFNQLDRSGKDKFFVPFMKRRLNRIIPLHYLTLVVFVVFISPYLIFNHFAINLASHLLFIHNFSYDLHGAINGSNWSLGVEMQFYILIALTAHWLKHVKWWVLLLCSLGISYAWRLAAVYLVDIQQPLGIFKLFVSATQLPGMLDEFAVGILLARLLTSQFGHRLVSNRKYSTVSLMCAAVALTTGAMCIYLKYASFWNYPLMVIFFRTLLAAAFGMIVLTLCSLKITPLLKRILYPLYYCGTISYGIYLWHLPILLSIKKLDWLTHSQSLALVLVLTLLMASLSWHFFEKHFIKK